MTSPIIERVSISKQRSYWLRCFLEAMLFTGMVVGFSTKNSNAMTCVVSRVRVAHLQGEVFDPSGIPLPQSRVRVSQGISVIAETLTDNKGHFAVKLSDGTYRIEVEMAGFHGLHQEIEIAHDVFKLVHPGHLRVILGLGGFNCPYATTSKREFDGELTAAGARLKQKL
jgi:hypothetical protein